MRKSKLKPSALSVCKGVSCKCRNLKKCLDCLGNRVPIYNAMAELGENEKGHRQRSSVLLH